MPSRRIEIFQLPQNEISKVHVEYFMCNEQIQVRREKLLNKYIKSGREWLPLEKHQDGIKQYKETMAISR